MLAMWQHRNHHHQASSSGGSRRCQRFWIARALLVRGKTQNTALQSSPPYDASLPLSSLPPHMLCTPSPNPQILFVIMARNAPTKISESSLVRITRGKV